MARFSSRQSLSGQLALKWRVENEGCAELCTNLFSTISLVLDLCAWAQSFSLSYAQSQPCIPIYYWDVLIGFQRSCSHHMIAFVPLLIEWILANASRNGFSCLVLPEDGIQRKRKQNPNRLYDAGSLTFLSFTKLWTQMFPDDACRLDQHRLKTPGIYVSFSDSEFSRQSSVTAPTVAGDSGTKWPSGPMNAALFGQSPAPARARTSPTLAI